MILVVALLVKALAAVLAHPRLVVLVDAHVGVERRAAVERLAAQLAHVRLLARVYYLVTAERGCLAEALAAHLAHERPHARVHRHVPRQIVVRIEHLVDVKGKVKIFCF